MFKFRKFLKELTGLEIQSVDPSAYSVGSDGIIRIHWASLAKRIKNLAIASEKNLNWSFYTPPDPAMGFLWIIEK